MSTLKYFLGLCLLLAYFLFTCLFFVKLINFSKMCSSNSNDIFIQSDYWTAINIWIKNPHVINRRLCGVENLMVQCFSYKQLKLLPLINELFNLKYDLVSSNINHIIKNTLEKLNLDISLQNIDFQHLFDDLKSDNLIHDTSHVLVIQKLIPRGPRFNNAIRICILDLCGCEAIFVNKLPDSNELIESAPKIPYKILLRNGEIIIENLYNSQNTKSTAWLQDTLLTKLKKWAGNKTENTGIVQGSLNLVSLDKYNSKYQELKLKYGKEMVKIWPECTDPSKFVYEDVAIATYLLLVWEEERDSKGAQERQSFVDLGCGNGLLVYILAAEGHPGRGVDVRKRDIWDSYPDFVKLEIDTITPSMEYLYKDTNWIIGNHSDELTPWIPVIAARSSYKTNFFLLPCCAYEFNGKKYQRSNSSKSQYGEYMEYVKSICNVCGIKTQIDRLKIPSTKRICLIGTDRLYKEELFIEKNKEIKEFIDKRCENNDETIVSNDSHLQDCWVSDFKTRERVEKVRNCTKIDKKIIDDIVQCVSRNLLKEKNYLNSKWNAGGCVPLNEIVKMLPADKLKMLKQECGGVQTLLKNHHHIFEVVGGKVKFRYPRTRAEVLKHMADKQRKSKVKKDVALNQRPCWFHSNHPDGCPLDETECSYVHK